MVATHATSFSAEASGDPILTDLRNVSRFGAWPTTAGGTTTGAIDPDTVLIMFQRFDEKGVTC